jgi:hypothetical protein
VDSFVGAVATTSKGVIERGVAGIRDYLNHARESLDAEKQIDALGDGDTFAMKLGASGYGGVVSAGAVSRVEAKRIGNQYVVSAEGAEEAGFFAQLGANLFGLGAEVYGSATAKGVQRVEFTFSDAAAAKRGFRAVASDAAGIIAGSLHSGVVGTGGSDSDRDFLMQHASAVERRGGLGGDVSAFLGGKGMAAYLGTLNAGANATEDQGTRVELKNGKPTALVLRSRTTVEASANAWLFGTRGSTWLKTRNALGGKTALTAISDHRFALPRNASVSDALYRPEKALGVGSIAQAEPKASQRLTLVGEISGVHGGVGSGVEARAVLDGSQSIARYGKELASEFMNGALGGQAGLADAARRSGGSFQAQSRDFKQTGVELKPLVQVMGVGFGAEGSSLRRDYLGGGGWMTAPLP